MNQENLVESQKINPEEKKLESEIIKTKIKRKAWLGANIFSEPPI